MKLKVLHLYLSLALISVVASGCGGSSSPSGESVGKHVSEEKRLTNGTEVSDDAAPYIRRMLAVLSTGSSLACSGAYISPNHYLTAAHCVIEEGVGPIPPSQIYVENGTNSYQPAAGVAIHPSYTGQIVRSSEAPAYYTAHDMAIVLVAEPLQGDPVPVSLASPASGQIMMLAGFGMVDENNDGGQILRIGTATIDHVSLSEGTIYFSARSLSDSAVCYGDSGGPSFAQLIPEGPLVIVGVNSTGSPPCQLGGMNANTLVSHPDNLNFITMVTGGYHLSN